MLVLDKRPNKGKFKPRAIEGILVDYANTCRGYRIWIPKNLKIIVARNVKFLEKFGRSNPPRGFCGRIYHKRGKLFNDATEPDDRRIAKVEANQSGHESGHSEDESILDESDNPEEDQPVTEDQLTAREPGCPRRILTRRPSRPAKQYQTKKSTQQWDADRYDRHEGLHIGGQ